MVRIKLLREGAKLPSYATVGSACRDIYLPENTTCLPGQVTIVPLGFAVDIPYGYEMQIRARSGMSLKFPNYVANQVGTIDSDYRDEVCLLFMNWTRDIIQLMAGDRVCQCSVIEVPPFDYIEVDNLDDTNNRGGGLGSTGGFRVEDSETSKES